WSAWGLFGNGSYVKGKKIPTGAEEGFEYKGPSANLGVDKRLNQNWVIGGMVGYQKQSLDFTPFNGNLAVGSSDLTGISVMPYVMFESDHWYLNLSLGYQHMSFDTDRLVNYGTQPATPLPVTVTVLHQASDPSKATATSFSSFDTLGFSMRPVAAWVIEPSLSFDYQHVSIGQFTEQDPNNQGFSFLVDSQTINSLEAIPALRTQYTFTPGFGVWTPYVDVQWHHQFNTNQRTVNALYAGAQNVLTSAASFSIKTDELDPWYQVYSAGISAVLRGSSAGETHNSGGLQVYLAYRQFEGLKNYEQKVYAAGFRYEF
ncbi:MAG TPA: autotransporter outer membrane beta-barrel domain-containing protein, partial [Steroidobacteraceae bacterium]|nr:autotransporter outer membrane beta-barrel domain-containing protein [Steroidobacteraceae bacterium]